MITYIDVATSLLFDSMAQVSCHIMGGYSYS